MSHFYSGKKDPLHDAVKSVMQENQKIREITENVNKLFGVSNPNALTHENRAKYDAKLAEVLKNPEIISEELKGNQHKIDANKNKKIDAHDFKLLRMKKKTMAESEKEDDEKEMGVDAEREKAKKEQPDKAKYMEEKAPPGAKFERMVKHIKKKYSKGGLTDQEKSIAYATAWKAKKKEVSEESALDFALNPKNRMSVKRDPKLAAGGVAASKPESALDFTLNDAARRRAQQAAPAPVAPKPAPVAPKPAVPKAATVAPTVAPKPAVPKAATVAPTVAPKPIEKRPEQIASERMSSQKTSPKQNISPDGSIQNSNNRLVKDTIKKYRGVTPITATQTPTPITATQTPKSSAADRVNAERAFEYRTGQRKVPRGMGNLDPGQQSRFIDSRG